VNIAKYIIQQGQYSTDQITILTPYLGQLSLIRKKLQETKMGCYLSDQGT
jgi:superfamily I DNA and/or RNA helicase